MHGCASSKGTPHHLHVKCIYVLCVCVCACVWHSMHVAKGAGIVFTALTLSPVEICFRKGHTNLYGVFILGVNIKYGLFLK